MKLPIEVVDAIKQNRCLAFVGSRFASEAAELANAAYPEPKDLAKELGWKKPKPVMGQKPKPVAASVEEGATAFEAANGRAALVAKLSGQLGCAGVPPTEAHKVMLSLFPTMFSTCMDDLFERAARESGVTLDVVERTQKVPDIDKDRRTLVRLRGGFDRPETLVLTPADFQARAFPAEVRKQLRSWIRQYVIFFVGFRPDEEEFEHLFAELSDAFGGELPRCHLAVSQGAIDDYLWQKWVWRGLLMFTADPTEVARELLTGN